MSLSVLTDVQIRALLENLTADELEGFRNSLKSALHEYSTGTQSIEDGYIHQPHRTTISSAKTGTTTLFMPSCSTVGVGIKVITLSPPQSKDAKDTKPNVRPTGAITLFSETGAPVGILHASTLTAFRTALASACLLVKRQRVHTLTLFGCGEQAFWHVRLALMERGSTIKHVNIINRRFSDNCKTILQRFYSTPAHIKEREGWKDATFSILTPGYGEYQRLQREQIRAADVIFCCTPSTQALFDASVLTNHEGRKKGRLIVAVGSYTPEMAELPVELLQQATKTHDGAHRHYHKHAPEGGVIIVDTLDGAMHEAGEIISAGLSPKQLVELGELVMLHRIRQDESEMSDASSLNSSSNLSADFDKLEVSSNPSSMSTVFGSTSGSETPASPSRTSSPHRRSNSGFFHRRSSSQGPSSSERQKTKDDHLARWLTYGNVVYKSVGLGLMDLTVGMDLIRFAKDRGIGSHIEGF